MTSTERIESAFFLAIIVVGMPAAVIVMNAISG